MSHLNVVNFQDITFNFSENSFKPFCKVTQTLFCINVYSNHPRSIIRQIPNPVNIGINLDYLRVKNIFYENSSVYDETLEKSGFKQRLEYLEILKDNFETGNIETNNNNNVNNKNNSNSISKSVNSETNWITQIIGITMIAGVEFFKKRLKIEKM